MQIKYDEEFNILRVIVKDDKIVDSEHIEKANIVIDYNDKDEIVAYEIFLPKTKEK